MSFKVAPIDTGDCYLQLSVGKNKKRSVSLISKIFHASPCPMPPIFIAGIRSGEIIYDLPKNAGLFCGFDKSMGIFEGYSILSWKAKLGDREFKGAGEALSKELIDLVNKPAAKDQFLSFTVELTNNNTGFRTSEGVFIVR